MDVVEAINLLKKYDLYNKAESECRRLKIAKAPYDMQGHHDVYCRFLNQKCHELMTKREALQGIRCVEWDNIERESKQIHNYCSFASVSILEKYCKIRCKYYQEKIEPLEQEISMLSQAQKVLKKAAQEDFYLK